MLQCVSFPPDRYHLRDCISNNLSNLRLTEKHFEYFNTHISLDTIPNILPSPTTPPPSPPHPPKTVVSLTYWQYLKYTVYSPIFGSLRPVCLTIASITGPITANLGNGQPILNVCYLCYLPFLLSMILRCVTKINESMDYIIGVRNILKIKSDEANLDYKTRSVSKPTSNQDSDSPYQALNKSEEEKKNNDDNGEDDSFQLIDASERKCCTIATWYLVIDAMCSFGPSIIMMCAIIYDRQFSSAPAPLILACIYSSACCLPFILAWGNVFFVCFYIGSCYVEYRMWQVHDLTIDLSRWIWRHICVYTALLMGIF